MNYEQASLPEKSFSRAGWTHISYLIQNLCQTMKTVFFYQKPINFLVKTTIKIKDRTNFKQ